VDLLVGTGGTPERVLAACGLRCVGGEIFGRRIARDDAEKRAAFEGATTLGES
jgi:fructose-1,6-bisphosphatase II